MPAVSLRDRVALSPAVLKDATSFIVEHHYLHRGRRMAQLAYWAALDGERVGVVLFSLPRLSSTFHGYHPMQLLELARLWVDPRVQGQQVRGSDGRLHALPVTGCIVGRALRIVRSDWSLKYPHLPAPLACVAWSDTTLHAGTVYKATNFRHAGIGGGRRPGVWERPTGGSHLNHADYLRPKAAFLFVWHPPSPAEPQAVAAKGA